MSRVSFHETWGIFVTSSPLDGGQEYLAGPLLFGLPPSPVGKALFATRREARQVLADWKARSRWAFTGQWAHKGGSRIYRNATVYRVEVKITAVTFE